jgi:hypothetical protein
MVGISLSACDFPLLLGPTSNILSSGARSKLPPPEKAIFEIVAEGFCDTDRNSILDCPGPLTDSTGIMFIQM